MMRMGRATKYRILEAMAVVCLFIAGIGLRIPYISQEDLSIGTCLDAFVVNDKLVPYKAGAGISQVYLYMLRGLFTLYGNRVQAAIIAQIVLFGLGAFVFYCAIRKINGVMGSLAVMAVMFFVPLYMEKTYVCGPWMLYFLIFSVGLYYTHCLVMDSKNEEAFSVVFLLQTIITGLFVGLLIYLHMAGMLLILPILFIPYLMRKKVKILNSCAVCILWLLAAGAGFISCGLAEGWIAGCAVENVLEGWVLYCGWKELLLYFMSVAKNPVSAIVMPVTAGWLLVFIMLTYIFTLVYHVIYLIFQRSTKTVRELDVEGLLMVQEDTAEQNARALELLLMPEKREDMKENEVTESVEKTVEETDKPSVNFIENPLPLPKKHVAKVLDYSFQPDFEDMDYDVKVSETDDYDV